MSYSIDVNIFLYATNSSDPHHKKSCQFLEQCYADSQLIVLTYPTIMAFLRLSTHPSSEGQPRTGRSHRHFA